MLCWQVSVKPNHSPTHKYARFCTCKPTATHKHTGALGLCNHNQHLEAATESRAHLFPRTASYFYLSLRRCWCCLSVREGITRDRQRDVRGISL